MRQIIFFVFLIVLAVSSTRAQDPKTEPGKPEELKGLVRIHVDANDERARQNIVIQISRQLPQLTITDKAEDAQVLLRFHLVRRAYRNRYPTAPRGSIERRGSTQQTGSTNTTNLPSGEYEIIAFGEVIKPVGSASARRLLKFNDTLSSALEDRLSEEFAGQFIKVYKKANQK